MSETVLINASRNVDDVKAQIPADYPLERPFTLDNVVIPEDEDMGFPDEDAGDDGMEVEMESGFERMVVVDCIPQVPAAKVEKLSNVLRKIFSSIGGLSDKGLHVPVDPATGGTRGFCFVEYETEDGAAAAVEQADGYELDKAHKFRVMSFDESKRYEAMSEAYKPPDEQDMVRAQNPLEWLSDAHARDQFVIRYQDETEVYWNDFKANKADPVYKRSFWTESYVQWSPKGTYLATVHRQGVALWGGTNWQRIQRINHGNVRLIEFSPDEHYVVTYSTEEGRRKGGVPMVRVCISDVRSGHVLREFLGSADEFSFPFKWSYDSKFVARMVAGAVFVYTMPDVQLLDKKSFKIPGLTDFQWATADIGENAGGEPCFAVFVPEMSAGNVPAVVRVIAVPSRKEVRQKQLFSVKDVKLHWHPQAKYLGVRIDRYTKSKKSFYTSFELFRMQEEDIPIEVLELKKKDDKVIAFAWEPMGDRLAYVHGEGMRPDVTFCSMFSTTGTGKNVQRQARLQELTHLKQKGANALYWSPKGRFVVLAGLKNLNGQFEFFDAEELNTLASGEHFMATDAEWDPTGRYFVTAVTSVHTMENGYCMWNFMGNLLFRNMHDKFYQVVWRPRPPTLLTPAQVEDVKKNLKKYSKRYEEEDELLRLKQDDAFREIREELATEWHEYISIKLDEWVDTKADRMKLRGGLEPQYDSEDETCYEMVEHEHEEILDVKEEVLEVAKWDD